MAKKNEKVFRATINGTEHVVECHCYRKGYTNYESVCCKTLGVRGSYSYMNRPWQSFMYDSALTEMIGRAGKKHGKYTADQLRIQIWEVEETRVRKEADELFRPLEEAIAKSSPEVLDRLAASGVMLTSPEQAPALANIINQINAVGELTK